MYILSIPRAVNTEGPFFAFRSKFSVLIKKKTVRVEINGASGFCRYILCVQTSYELMLYVSAKYSDFVSSCSLC